MAKGPPLPADCAARFRIERLLASGGFGAVYLATQLELSRPVAIKVLRAEVLQDADEIRRFVNEARITAMLAHPHIIKVFDHGASEGIPWIAYEYIDGPTVRELLRQGRLDPAQAVDLAIQVARALSAAHAMDVLHRDIKPENIFRSAQDFYKVADFGIAKWTQDTMLHTRTGLVIGTPAYISPEQINGEAAGPASDIYSLGAMLFELLTARLPFDAPNPALVMARHLRAARPKPSTLAPGVPAALDAIVVKAMARQPGERHASAAALVEALEAVRGEGRRGTTDRSRSDPGPAGRHEVTAPLAQGAPVEPRGAATAAQIDPLGKTPDIAVIVRARASAAPGPGPGPGLGPGLEPASGAQAAASGQYPSAFVPRRVAIVVIAGGAALALGVIAALVRPWPPPPGVSPRTIIGPTAGVVPPAPGNDTLALARFKVAVADLDKQVSDKLHGWRAAELGWKEDPSFKTAPQRAQLLARRKFLATQGLDVRLSGACRQALDLGLALFKNGAAARWPPEDTFKYARQMGDLSRDARLLGEENPLASLPEEPRREVPAPDGGWITAYLQAVALRDVDNGQALDALGRAESSSGLDGALEAADPRRVALWLCLEGERLAWARSSRLPDRQSQIAGECLRRIQDAAPSVVQRLMLPDLVALSVYQPLRDELEGIVKRIVTAKQRASAEKLRDEESPRLTAWALKGQATLVYLKQKDPAAWSALRTSVDSLAIRLLGLVIPLMESHAPDPWKLSVMVDLVRLIDESVDLDPTWLGSTARLLARWNEIYPTSWTQECFQISVRRGTSLDTFLGIATALRTKHPIPLDKDSAQVLLDLHWRLAKACHDLRSRFGVIPQAAIETLDQFAGSAKNIEAIDSSLTGRYAEYARLLQELHRP